MLLGMDYILKYDMLVARSRTQGGLWSWSSICEALASTGSAALLTGSDVFSKHSVSKEPISGDLRWLTFRSSS